MTEDNGDTKVKISCRGRDPTCAPRGDEQLEERLMFLTEQEALQLCLAGNTETRGVVVAVAKRHYVTNGNVALLFGTKMKSPPRGKKTTNVAQ